MEQSIAGERAILVSIARDTPSMPACEKSMDELAQLLETAGGECFARMIQVKASFDPATCIGKGKLEELAALCKDNEIPLVIFDFELSPSQIRNLEDALEQVHVIDRSMLILDIFALHASSGEGKLQVELAQLKYTAPRLVGQGLALSRLGGTIGTRGPGETKLETDRRHIHRRIVALQEQIAEMEKNRRTMRAGRDRSGIVKVALVGYTNAGKSSILNLLTDAGVLSENKLFATLDPTTRKLILPEGDPVLLTDTVGFIRNLPHHLIKAFRSTLDEAVCADLLCIVVDCSDPSYGEHLEVTLDTLRSLGAEAKPILYVYNKADLLPEGVILPVEDPENTVFLSAATGVGVEEFLEKLTFKIRQNSRKATLLFQYSEQNIAMSVYGFGNVESVEYLEEGIRITAILDAKGLGKFKSYMQISEDGLDGDGSL